MIKVRYHCDQFDRGKALFNEIEAELNRLGFGFVGKVLCHPTHSINQLNQVIEAVLVVEDNHEGKGRIKTFNVWTERVTQAELRKREIQSNSYAKERKKIID